MATDETSDQVNELCSTLRSIAEFGCCNAKAAEKIRSAANFIEVQRMSMNSLMAPAAAVVTLDLGEGSTDGAAPRTSWRERQDEIAHLHKVIGWRAATSTIRAWAEGEPIQAPALVDELRYWLRSLGGHDFGDAA